MSGANLAPSERAIQDGLAKLEQLRMSGTARSITRFALRSLKQSNPETLVASVRAVLHDLEEIGKVLHQVLDDGEAARSEEAASEPYGMAWLGELRDRLDGIEQQAGRPARMAAWWEAWTAALRVSQLDACDEIAKLRSVEGDLLQPRLKAVTEGLRSDVRLIAALQAVKAILAEEDIPVAATVALSVLAARGERRLDNFAQAARFAEAGYQRLDYDTAWPIRALAIAGMAEVQLAAHYLDKVHELLDPVSAQPATVDLLTATGMLATRERRYSRANQIFDVAAATFGLDAVRPDLLREIPGNLIWRTARRVRLTDPHTALTLFDRALKATIVGDSSTPQRRPIAERAELLEQLGRLDDAAGAYQLAGTQYFQSKPSTAIRLLAKATSLAPHVPEYQLWYGEALRLSAAGLIPAATSVTRLREARRALARGLRGGVAPDNAWALVSAALVAQRLATVPGSDSSEGEGASDEDAGIDSTVEADVLIERALLLDGDPRTLGFLLHLLRFQGFPKDALQDIDVDSGRRTGDEVLTLYSAMVLSDLGRDADAIRLVEGYLSIWPPTTDLETVLVYARLRCDGPDSAVDSLDADSHDPDSSILRATCLRAAGRHSEARAVLHATVSEPETAQDLRRLAWATYLLGDVDEAIDGYLRWLALGAGEVEAQGEPAAGVAGSDPAHAESYAGHDPDAEYAALTQQPVESDPVVWLDLGQMLLLRGREDDLEHGQQMIGRAIAACTEAGALVQATSLEFPLLREAVRGSPHEDDIVAIIAELSALAEDRCEDLRSRTRDRDLIGPRLGHARRLLDADHPQGAFTAYAELLRSGGPAECALGLDRAAAQLLRTADVTAADDVTAGVARWQAIEDLFVLHAPGHHSVERRQIATRLALAALETKGADEGTAHLFQAIGVGSVLDALPLFLRDVASTWAHYDGLRTLAERHPELSGLISVSDRMPLGPVYGLHRERSAVGAMPVVETAIAVTLGPQHADLVGSEEIRAGFRSLRDRLVDRLGVRIPGALVTSEETLPDLTVRVTVYGEEAARFEAPFTTAADQEHVIEILAERLGDNIFRFMTIDDLDLWAVGWDSDFSNHDGGKALSWMPPDPVARARLAWVLRTLLREGLPITERRTILEAFSGADARDPWSPPHTLEAVRRVLHPAILGPYSATQVRSLPEHLSTRLAKGLIDGSARTWELPRDEARALISDVTEWRGSREGPIAVAGPACRLALWRLLAAQRPRVYVVAAEEMP